MPNLPFPWNKPPCSPVTVNMDRTDSTEPSPSLITIGGGDAPVCVDGFCEVPAAVASAPTTPALKTEEAPE